MDRRTGEIFFVRQAVAQAVATLRAHPLRSTLGVLAIFVGVFTVTTVITALDGVALYAQASAARLFGSDTFVIAQIASPGQTSRRELERKLQRNLPIRRPEVRAVERLSGGQVLYAPTVQRTADVVAGARRFEAAAVTGTTEELAAIRDLGIERGRFLAGIEVTRAAQVVVLGADLASTLFPGIDPLGESVRIGGRAFQVVGVQAKLGTSSGASLDRYAWLPLPTFERLFGAPPTLQVFARSADDTGGTAAVQAAEDTARAAMRARRQLRPGVEDTFDVLTPDAARSFVFRLSERIGMAAVPISIMALLAAVVVVTNTVLVSVSQRTREIGVRRALGAPRRQVLREVFAESILVSLLGGGLALGASWLAVDAAARAAALPVALRPATAAWALFASVASGLAAGWYPARRAVRIDVVTALRTE
jgi:putative ABC transport system permease protein